MLRILVLGAAAGGGFPQWNSNDQASQRARRGDPKARTCSQSSVAVSADGKWWVVLNASPDIRQQINENEPLHPKEGIRHSPIAAVILTNGDVDHVAGLLTLRESHPLVVYATARVLDVLKQIRIFDVLNPRFVDRVPIALGVPFEPRTKSGESIGLVIEGFAVPGKVALYLEGEMTGDSYGAVGEDTIGLKVSNASAGTHFYYLPGCAALSRELRERLASAPLLLFDGTLWQDDEMLRAGTGEKTGRRMGHMSVTGPDGAIASLEPLGIARKVFVHINNTNPILLSDSAERRLVEAAGWEVAYDGMEIVL